MRRHDDQTRVFHADEHHQHEVRGMIRSQKAGLVNLPAILAGRLIAVVAVGNENRLRPDDRGDRGNRAHIRHRPNLADDAQMIGCHDRSQACSQPCPICSEPHWQDRGRVRKSGSDWHFVVVISMSRSTFGPGKVSSCGKTLPSPNGESLARAMKPRRLYVTPSAVNSWW